MTISTLPLSESVAIPQLGFGVWQVPDDEATDAVTLALEAGYRHIDTARIYGNEEGVGRALERTDIPREDIFVTTKVWNDDHGYDATLRAFDASAERLGLDVIDLYLIHWPVPAAGLFVEAWRALERLRTDGRARAVGVSNFRIEDLEALAAAGLSTPQINQVELHPQFSNRALQAFHDAHGIVTEAWSPLGQGTVLADPVIGGIASAHGATPAQVVLAWHLAQGRVAIPKSVTPHRIVENFAALQVELTAADLAAIDALETGQRIGSDPADV